MESLTTARFQSVFLGRSGLDEEEDDRIKVGHVLTFVSRGIRTTIDDVTFLVLPNGVVISGRVVQWGTDAYRWEWMDFEIAAPECSARPFEFVGLEGAPRPRHAQGSRNEVPFFNKADSRPKFLLRHYLRSAEAE